jgi:hypothetical protein
VRSGGGLLDLPHFEVSGEVRQPGAQECERRSLVYLLGIVGEPHVRPEVAVHHGRTVIEFGSLNSHIRQPDPLFPPIRAAQIEPAFDTREARSLYDARSHSHSAYQPQQWVT